MIIYDDNNKLQPKTLEARKRASAKYNKKTYRTKSVYIKLTEIH